MYGLDVVEIEIVILSIRHHRILMLVIAGGSLIVALIGAIGPHLLVMSNAIASDYILVLDGHDETYYAGLTLLSRGFGRRMFICPDLPDVVFRGEERQLDLDFIKTTAGSLADRIELCTNTEDEDIASIIATRATDFRFRKILLVTPEVESRAQLITFRRELPQYSWTVESVSNGSFNPRWWRKRRWTLTYLRSLVNLERALRITPERAQPVQRSAR